MTIKAGAGAFVCGEETALIESLEGHRGMPRLKPPFPAQSGYWRKPSNINNVETFANVSWIINNGGEAFASMGTEGSKGTKVFAVTGKVKRSGLVEIPMGKTLRDVIFDIGGGMKGDKAFKAVQMGGPSGGCIPAELIDTVIDYKALGATGAIMGSGGMVVMDEGTCMVGMAKFFLTLLQRKVAVNVFTAVSVQRECLKFLQELQTVRGKTVMLSFLKSFATELKTVRFAAWAKLRQTLY